MKKTLKFFKPMKINTNGKDKLMVNGEELKTADIPAVRYHFSMNDWLIVGEDGTVNINQDTLATVTHNRNELKKSLHIVELEECGIDMTALANIIRSACPKIAIFAYIDFDNKYDEQFVAKMGNIKAAIDCETVDRIMLREMPGVSLDAYGVKALQKYMNDNFGFRKTEKYGLCDSPIGCTLGMSCLSAVLCRELSAKYGDDLDMVVPSQNHEGMNNETDRACNCLFYVAVNSICACSSSAKNVKAGSKKDADKHDDNNSGAPKNNKSTSGRKLGVRW